MSKNISINEGRTAKAFTNVAKLQTKLTGSDDVQYWIPEDEVLDYVDLQTLDVEENGQYQASEEGCDGFSTVNVNVQPDLEEITIDENGTYFAEDEGCDGFSVVSVQVPGGGPVPAGEEIEGYATANLELYDSVRVVKEPGTLNFVTTDTQQGFVRKDVPDSIYKQVDNKWNRYNIVTGNLIKEGTSTVYESGILNGGRCAWLRLSNNSGTMPSDGWTSKFRFIWYDGTIATITFKHGTHYDGQGPQVGVSNNYIAILYPTIDQSNRDKCFTANIYDKKGNLVTKELSFFGLGSTGYASRSVYNIVPLSPDKIACWYYQVDYWGYYSPAAIVQDGLKCGNRFGAGVILRPYYYRSYYYYSLNNQVYKRIASDPYDSAIPVGTPLNAAMGEINIFGHFQAYTEVEGETKYRLYDINTFTDVYPEIIENTSSHFLRENQKYLIFGKTYLKESANLVFPTQEYPAVHSGNIVLGIVKKAVKAAEKSTVIVLFT